MAFVIKLDGQRLYLDANVLIYAVEGFAQWADRARGLLAAIDSGLCAAVTSELSLAECLVKPVSLGRRDLIAAYEDTIRSRKWFVAAGVTRDILVKAAAIRAETRLRLPDAIHVATYDLHGCSMFVTNDRRLESCPGVQVVTLTDMPPHQTPA